MTLSQIKRLEKRVRGLPPSKNFTMAAGSIARLCRLARTGHAFLEWRKLNDPIKRREVF